MSCEHSRTTLCESEILAEIAYYERQAAAAAFMPSTERDYVRDRYLSFAQRRRQLLAAFLDGRPCAWRHYAPVSTCGHGGAASAGRRRA